MTPGGWITFILSAGALVALFAWCLYKVITTKRPRDSEVGGAFDIYEKK